MIPYFFICSNFLIFYIENFAWFTCIFFKHVDILKINDLFPLLSPLFVQSGMPEDALVGAWRKSAHKLWVKRLRRTSTLVELLQVFVLTFCLIEFPGASKILLVLINLIYFLMNLKFYRFLLILLVPSIRTGCFNANFRMGWLKKSLHLLHLCPIHHLPLLCG